MSRSIRALPASLAVWLLAGAAAPAGLEIQLDPFLQGLDRPLGLVPAGDGSGRQFALQQGGLIRVADGAPELGAFLDLSDRVSSGAEQGLLGLAFHPAYASNGFFYVDYTDLAGDTIIARYSVSAGDPNRADPDSAFLVLSIDQPDAFTNHNGGQLQFGPDGYLYIGVGDGGGQGDPDGNGQDLSTLLGAILRIDVDGDDFPEDPKRNYAVPLDNPFVGRADALGEIWAYGLRNPWRFSFDRLTGDLFVADVGQASREEIDFQPASSPGGENYGWSRMEGSACFDPPAGCDDGTLVLPILEYGHGSGDCSVTGGYRYRGSNPSRFGVYFYGDFCSGRIWAAHEQAPGLWSSQLVADSAAEITSFAQDEAGELYVVDRAGTIFRMPEPGALRLRAAALLCLLVCAGIRAPAVGRTRRFSAPAGSACGRSTRSAPCGARRTSRRPRP